MSQVLAALAAGVLLFIAWFNWRKEKVDAELEKLFAEIMERSKSERRYREIFR